MISLYTKNKGKLTICEDSLTSHVFDLMKYLPVELFWSILKKSLYQDKLPDYSGEIEDILFWEKWNADKTDNARFVEPDLFLRFKNFDVIIEAKRYDDFQQNEKQHKDQMQSYINEFEIDNKQLYYIQLGGLHDKGNVLNNIINNHDIIICKSDWSSILNQIVKEKENFESVTISYLTPYKRIFEDLIAGFELHQFYKKSWLETLKIDTNLHPQNINQLFTYVKRN
jgi:hypothetical protein